MSYTELLAEWSDLLERRATFREALGHYAGILTAWSRWPSHRIAPLRWSVDECRERWRRGVPLLAETTPGIPSNDLDDLLSPALEFLTAAGHDVGALRRFAEAWDDGAVEPAVFLPERGRLGSPAQHDVEGDEELACEGDLRLGAMHDAEVATPQIVVRTSGERSGLAQHPTEQGVALLRDLAEALFVGRRVDRRRQADNVYAGDAVLVESAIAGGTR